MACHHHLVVIIVIILYKILAKTKIAKQLPPPKSHPIHQRDRPPNLKSARAANALTDRNANPLRCEIVLVFPLASAPHSTTQSDPVHRLPRDAR